MNYSEANEADDKAKNYLISEKDYETFIAKYRYTDKAEIISYSNKIGIAPNILVGRLQHDGYLEPHSHNDLRPLFEIDGCLKLISIDFDSLHIYNKCPRDVFCLSC